MKKWRMRRRNWNPALTLDGIHGNSSVSLDIQTVWIKGGIYMVQIVTGRSIFFWVARLALFLNSAYLIKFALTYFPRTGQYVCYDFTNLRASRRRCNWLEAWRISEIQGKPTLWRYREETHSASFNTPSQPLWSSGNSKTTFNLIK